MVGFEPQSRELPKSAYSVAGAASGVMTRCVAQPLDVLKIRFQLQVESLRSSSAKYRNMFQATGAIYRQEGLAAFWKGHAPAQCLSLVFGVVQFTSFEILTKNVWVYLPKYFTTDIQPVTHFSCGMLAGCAAMAAGHPFDVIRTRFVAQGEPKTYKSMYSAVQRMITTEGVFSLYKGLTPALLQVAPQTGLQFGFYSLFTGMWVRVFGGLDGSKFAPWRSLLCGSAAGLCAKLSIYPLDMIKKRLQVQGFAEARKDFGRTDHYTGLKHCCRTIVAREGFRGLYKGIGPSLVKALVTVGIHFQTYEWCCHVLRTLYNAK